MKRLFILLVPAACISTATTSASTGTAKARSSSSAAATNGACCATARSQPFQALSWWGTISNRNQHQNEYNRANP